MIDCITVIANQEVDDETNERVSEVVSTLRETSRLNADFGNLNQRQLAVTEIADLTRSAPAAIIPHVPVLVRTLNEELIRGTSKNSATNIVYSPISRNIRQRVTEVLEMLSMGAVVTQYEELDESLSSLFEVLIQEIIEEEETAISLNALRALCGFAQYRPEKVAQAITHEGDPATVLNLSTRVLLALLDDHSLSSSHAVTSRGSVGWWARFVAMITFRNQHPDYLPSTHAYRLIPNNLQDIDDIGIAVFSDLLSRIMPSKRNLDTVQKFGWNSVLVYTPVSDSGDSTSVESGIERSHQSETEDDRDLSPITRIKMNGPNSDASEAFGEIIATCPQVVPDPPWELINHLRELDHRKYAARSLGGVAAAGATKPTEQLQLARRWAEANTKLGWKYHREMLGEIAAAHSNTMDIPDSIRPLVEKVKTGSGQSRINAALALGEAVYQSGDPSTAVDPTPAFRRYIREEQTFSDAAAKGLGEAIITMGPQNCAVSVPSAAIDQVRGDRGRSRKDSSEALGLAAATDSLGDLPTKLVSKAHTRKGQIRWAAGRTLGELIGILDAACDTTPWPDSLLKKLRGADGQLRFDHAELVGVAISALEADAHGIDNPTKLGRSGLSGPDRLLLYVLTRGGMARYDMQKVVGELVVADAIPEHTPKILHPLVRLTAEAEDAERRNLMQTLGEAVAVAFGTDSGFGAIYALRCQVQTETGKIRYQAAQALGEAIAYLEGSNQASDLEGRLATAVRDTSGKERRSLAHAVGELHAAIDEPNTKCEPVAALKKKARADDDDVDWSATAAIGAIAILYPDEVDLASAVPSALIADVDSEGHIGNQASLEAVGSFALGIVDTFVQTAVNNAIESSNQKRAELLPPIMATDFYSLEKFLYLLVTAGPNDGEQGLTAVFDSKIRDHVLSALRELLSRGTTGVEDDLRRLLVSQLSSEESSTLEPEARLSLVDCLVECQPAKLKLK